MRRGSDLQRIGRLENLAAPHSHVAEQVARSEYHRAIAVAGDDHLAAGQNNAKTFGALRSRRKLTRLVRREFLNLFIEPCDDRGLISCRERVCFSQAELRPFFDLLAQNL
jgi:hypothetical protein